MKEKFESLKQKWDNPDKTKTLKRVAAVTTVVTLIAAVVNLAPKLKSLNRTLQQEAHDNLEWTDRMNREFLDEIAHRYADWNEINRIENLSRSQILLAASQYRAGKIDKAMDTLADKQGKLTNIFKKICETADKTKPVQNKFDQFERSLNRANRRGNN